jgi:UDP-glucose 4-epimerase
MGHGSAAENAGVSLPRDGGSLRTRPWSVRLLEESIPQLASGEWKLISCDQTGGRKHLGKRILICDLTYVDTADGLTQTDRVVAKVFKTDRGRRAYDAMYTLRRAGFAPPSACRVPRPYGYSRERCSLVQEMSSGIPWADHLREGGASLREASIAAGVWLARLHRATVAAPEGALERDLREADRFVEELSRVYPAHALRLRSIAAEVSRRLRHAPPAAVPSHGDFHPKNVLIEDDAATVIDFDAYALREPAFDVAYALAQLSIMSSLRLGDPGPGTEAGAAFLGAYAHDAGASRERVASWVARAFLQSLHYELCVFGNGRVELLSLWLETAERWLDGGEPDALKGILGNGQPASVTRDGSRRTALHRRPKALVTGGLGFIGSFVSESLASRGHDVTVVDSGVSSVVEPHELDGPPDRIACVAMNVQDFLSASQSLNGFHLVVHCASHVGPASVIRLGGRLGHSIVADTGVLIDACIDADVPLINFSSAEVYGKSGMLSEGSDIRVPPYYNARIEYALAKLTAEAMCINSKERGLRSVVLRPFNVAGPRQSTFGGFVMPTFVQQALAGRPITVFSTGLQKRAFLSIRDLCRFMNEYLDESVFDTPRVYNVGTPGNTTTIYDLAVRVRDELESDSEIVYADPRDIHGPLYQEAESFEKLPDIANAAELGWTPEITLEQLIHETASYYSSHEDPLEAYARA